MVTSAFSSIYGAKDAEQITTLARAAGMRIERIVSHGQCSPHGFWYDQDDDSTLMQSQREG
ncbi:MAG: hypothetical protein R8K50_00640 [Mariprofundus sp.]